MPTYKVVLFHDVANIPEKQYMSEQKNAIQNSLPSLTVELANSGDARLAKYTTNPTRMPCIIVFKDDARMAVKHAKLKHPDVINWIKARVE